MRRGKRVGDEYRSYWDIGDAVDLCRNLEERLSEVGWHVALAGGVLLRGESEHDLDLLIFPHCSRGAHRRDVNKALRALGWQRVRTTREMHRHWRSRGSRDTKRVEVWLTEDGGRVDLIEVR